MFILWELFIIWQKKILGTIRSEKNWWMEKILGQKSKKFSQDGVSNEL